MEGAGWQLSQLRSALDVEQPLRKSGRCPGGERCPGGAGSGRGCAGAREPPLGSDRRCQGSALRRGRTACRGMACYRAPGTAKARERRPIARCRGRRRSWLSPTSTRCIGTRNGDGVFPILVLFSPALLRVCTAQRQCAAADTPQLIALSARSERLSRSLSSWARSAGRSRVRLRSGRSD